MFANQELLNINEICIISVAKQGECKCFMFCSDSLSAMTTGCLMRQCLWMEFMETVQG